MCLGHGVRAGSEGGGGLRNDPYLGQMSIYMHREQFQCREGSDDKGIRDGMAVRKPVWTGIGEVWW